MDDYSLADIEQELASRGVGSSGGLSFSGTTGRSATNNNPLNLEYRPGSYQDKYGAELEPISKSGKQRFAKFPSMEAGYMAGIDQIKLDASRGHTLASFVNKFAPPHENPTNQIISQYAKAVGASPDTPLSEIPAEKLIIPMLARESSTRVVSPREAQIYSKLKNPGQVQHLRSFQPYQVVSAGAEIPGPPSTPTLNDIEAELARRQQWQPNAQDIEKELATRGVQPPKAHSGDFLAPKQPPEPLSIPGTLQKVLFSPLSVDKMKSNLSRWGEIAPPDAPRAGVFPFPYQVGSGLDNFNKDVTAAYQTPEAATFAALDPMVGIASGANKANLFKQKLPVDKQLETLGKVVGGVGERYDPKLIRQLQQTAQDFGIELTVPELTNSPTLRGLWVRLAKTPGPQAEKLANYMEEIRNPQVATAIQTELNNIAPQNLTKFQAGGQGVAAAGKVEEGLVNARRTATSPMYKAAFENSNPVNTEPVLGQLAEAAQKYPEGHPSLEPLQKVSKMLTKEQINPTTGDIKYVPETNLEVLHNANAGIGQLLDKAKRDNSIDNDTRRLLMGIKEKLKGQMETDNPLYNQAQGTFRLLSRPINDFKWGDPNIQPRDTHTQTVIARIAGLGDEAVAQAPSIIFESDPAQIARTRKWFETNYPGTWDGLVKAHLEDKLSKIKDTVVGREGNIGGVFKRTVFNDQNSKDKLAAALSPEKYDRLEKFMGVLDNTRRIIYTNSETAYQMEAGKILDQGGVSDFIKNVPTSKFGLMKWAAGVIDNINKPQFASDLADALLNPENAAKINKLNKGLPSVNNSLETALFLENIFQKTSGLNTPIEPRAKGGPVRPGKPYLVGEQGPEVIVPQQQGMVMPNPQAGGGIFPNLAVQMPNMNQLTPRMPSMLPGGIINKIKQASKIHLS